MQACPFESFCGSEIVTASRTVQQIQLQQSSTSSSNLFSQNRLCHYLVTFPGTAGAGDAIYINVIILRNVQTNIVIAKSMSDPYVTVCSGVQAGEYLLA